MDEIYDDLDNFNDENTIAELQAENKSLKSKLAEYASTLAKLQQEFDELSTQYKKLELNYSSLLKTAKSEIERKTEIIKNLNIEKDKMVLESFQKRYSTANRSHYYKLKIAQDDAHSTTKSKEHLNPDKTLNTDVKRIAPPQTGMDRTEKSHLPSKDEDKKTHKDTNNRNKLLTESSVQPVERIKHSDVKDNKINSKNEDLHQSRALIRNRRKSMPAVRSELVRISSDEDNISNPKTAKDSFRENPSKKNVQKYTESNNRMSETPSSEDRHSGYNEPKANTHRSRQSRCENDSYRTRSKSSHRHKKYSPERYHRGSKDYHDDPHYRSDHDKHRTEVANDRHYNLRRSREPHRNDYERKHSQEHERLQHRNQDRHPMKHRLQHTYDEIDTKRMKIDLHNRHNEEQRLQNERDFLEKKYISETFDDMPFYSCESPDYNNPDAIPVHQVREIKLNALTKLEDPRMLNKKYVVQKNDGKVLLSTTQGRNVDIIPVNKTAWGIKPVSIPEALLRRPSEEVVDRMHMDVEIPVTKLSVQSGEVCNVVDTKTPTQETNKETEFSKQDEIKIPATNAGESKNMVSSSQKLTSYKIPKLKQTADENQTKNITTASEKVVHENTCKNNTKVPDSTKPLHKQEKKEYTFSIQRNNELPFLGNSEICDKQNYATALEVEDDLQLSDDTCDNTDNQKYDTKEIVEVKYSNSKKDKDKNCNIETIIHPVTMCDNKTINKNDNLSSDTRHEKITIDPHKNKTSEDSKVKTKNKKKSKHKETKEEIVKHSFLETEKTTRKKGKESKTKPIKTKFCELFGDSNSLITPEDLGITNIPATSAARQPGQCVPFLEDAQDAVDLEKLQRSKELLSRAEQLNEDCKQKDSPVNIISINSQDPEEKKNGMKPSNEEPIEVIYKNIAPAIPEKQIDSIRTVIISTGLQPQILVEDEKQESASKVEAQIKHARHEVVLKALATSTPHKPCQPNVAQTELEVKLSDSTQSCNSDSRIMIDKATPLDNSNCNTLDSQNNDNDAPDVRIFVRRKRRVIKK